MRRIARGGAGPRTVAPRACPAPRGRRVGELAPPPWAGRRAGGRSRRRRRSRRGSGQGHQAPVGPGGPGWRAPPRRRCGAAPARPPGGRRPAAAPAGRAGQHEGGHGSAMSAWPRPSTRHRATSASLPGSSEPSSASRPRQRAPSSCPWPAPAGGQGGRAAAQAGEQQGPGGPPCRGGPTRWRRRRRRPGRPARRRPAGRPRARCRTPAGRSRWGSGATPVRVAPNRRTALGWRCTQWAARRRRPASRGRPGTRPACAEPLAAERLLVQRLGQVGVEADAAPAGQGGRLAQQFLGDRERRAGGDGDPEPSSPAPGRGGGRSRPPWRPGSRRVLDHLVGRQAAARAAEVHRAAAGVEAGARPGGPPRPRPPAGRRRGAGTGSGGPRRWCSRSARGRPAPPGRRRAPARRPGRPRSGRVGQPLEQRGLLGQAPGDHW